MWLAGTIAKHLDVESLSKQEALLAKSASAARQTSEYNLQYQSAKIAEACYGKIAHQVGKPSSRQIQV